MNIIRIITRLNVGGPARHVAWLTEALQNGEWESRLVTGTVPPGEDDMSYFAESLGVRPLIIPEMSREISFKDAITVWKLYRLFKRVRPDIIHTHTAKAGTVGRIAKLLYRWLTVSALFGRPRECRLVHTYHGHVFHSYYGAWKTRLFLFIEKTLALTATDRILVLSAQQLDEIHRVFGVGKRSQFSIVPLGIDLRPFADYPARRDILRAELKAETDDILVGIVGRLTEIKNHDLFLRAVALYKNKYGTNDATRRVRFVVIGDGQLRDKLEAQTAALGLNSDVVFLGTRADPENFYPALDLVALTSHNEGTPLTLIEAMANARPCVATAVGGTIDLLSDASQSEILQNRLFAVCARGILVQPNNAEAFSEAMARFVFDETLRRKLGEQGRAFITERYSKDRLVDDISKLYRELLALPAADHLYKVRVSEN